MRITGGSACGLKISTLAGRDIRPTSDRVREALFQILSVKFQHDWSDLRVLDLFAGSGSLGIEALSRGAEYVVFADMSSRSTGCIRQNLEKTGFLSRAFLARIDIRRQKPACRALMPHAPFDLVLADPPYKRGFGSRVISLVASCPLLSDQGLLVLEEFSGADVPGPREVERAGLMLEDTRCYGQTSLHFFRIRNSDALGAFPVCTDI